MKNPKENRGGNRPNAGRKKSPYKTKTISFRVRVEIAAEIKKIVKDIIQEKLKLL